MDLESSLASYSNNSECNKLSYEIVENPETFTELIQYFTCDDLRMVQRSANLLIQCVRLKPALIHPYIDNIITRLNEDSLDANKRNTLRLLQYVDIPEKHYGQLADYCFKWLDSASVPVAIRVFSMTVLLKIVTEIPELRDELRMMIEDHLPYGSAGFKSRGKKVLLKLQKL